MDAARELEAKYGLEMTFQDAFCDWSDVYWKHYNEQIQKHFTREHGTNVIRETIMRHHANRHQHLYDSDPDPSGHD